MALAGVRFTRFPRPHDWPIRPRARSPLDDPAERHRTWASGDIPDRPGATKEMAEGEGFEPPGARAPTVFKTVAFDRSATPPLVLDLEARRAPGYSSSVVLSVRLTSSSTSSLT